MGELLVFRSTRYNNPIPKGNLRQVSSEPRQRCSRRPPLRQDTLIQQRQTLSSVAATANMFGPVGITEVAAITQLAEEADEAAAFPFDILFNLLGVDVPGDALPSSADLEEYMDPDQFLHFLGELDWPRTQAARVEFTRTILSSTLVSQENGESDSDMLRNSSVPEVPTSCAVLASIIVSSRTDEEGWETIFWLLDREGRGVVSIASVWELLPAMASVAVAAVHTAYLGENSNSSKEASSKERGIKVFRLLEKALAQALDCLGSLQPGDLVSAEAFTALADKVAEELMLIVSQDEDSSEELDVESSRGSETALNPADRSFHARRTRIINRATTIGSSISSFKPWRKGKTGRAASDTGVGDGQTGSGLPATMGSPEAAALRGATPRTPRTPANNLVSISVSTGQQTEVNLRPSLLAAQKAAEQAAEAAAAELRPQRKSEQGVLKPAKEAISEQLLGLGVMVGTRLCIADAARMLVTSALLMTNAAIIAALIIHANIPIPAAIGYTVVIDIILAGIMFVLAYKGLSCCFSCCQPKRQRLDTMPSVFEEQVRPAVQKYVQNMQRMITNNEAPHNLRDVDEESALEGHESGDIMMQEFSGNLSRSHGIARDTGSPRSNAEPPVPVLQRAQSLWQVIGRVAGFEPQQGGFQSGAANGARIPGHHGVGPVSTPGSTGRPSSVVDPQARAQRSSRDEISPALSWAASPDGSPRRRSITSADSTLLHGVH